MGLDDILNLFQGPSVDSQGQLDAAKKRRSFSASQEAEARRKGFPSAQAAADWAKQKGGSSRGVSGSEQVRRGIEDASALHPKNILDRVSEALRNATGG